MHVVIIFPNFQFELFNPNSDVNPVVCLVDGKKREISVYFKRAVYNQIMAYTSAGSFNRTL